MTEHVPPAYRFAMPSSPTNPHPEPGRRHPAHWPTRERDKLSIIVFVTVCTQDRKRILACADAVAVLRGAWAEADAWVVGRYVIMPDYLHPFCSPVREEFLVQQWVAFWKSRASTRWPHPAEQPVWRRDCWDTQMRRGESCGSQWEYVRCNPVRHGLVAQPEDWPWAGEIERLEWHDPQRRERTPGGTCSVISQTSAGGGGREHGAPLCSAPPPPF